MLSRAVFLICDSWFVPDCQPVEPGETSTRRCKLTETCARFMLFKFCTFSARSHKHLGCASSATQQHIRTLQYIIHTIGSLGLVRFKTIVLYVVDGKQVLDDTAVEFHVFHGSARDPGLVMSFLVHLDGTKHDREPSAVREQRTVDSGAGHDLDAEIMLLTCLAHFIRNTLDGNTQTMG